MNRARSVIAILTNNAVLFLAGDHTGYLARPIPCELDQELTELALAYREGGSDERALARKQIDRRPLWSVLLTYAERMANRAVRETSGAWVEVGLTAIVMEDFRLDAREDWLVLALLYRSAVKLGHDPGEQFERAALMASERGAEALRQFTHRTDLAKIVENMGYHEDGDASEGFRYVRDW